jgi:hypothetical protein
LADDKAVATAQLKGNINECGQRQGNGRHTTLMVLIELHAIAVTSAVANTRDLDGEAQRERYKKSHSRSV